MKKIKLAFWAMIILIMLIFVFQNQVYFQTLNDLKINLFVYDEIKIPQVNNAIIILASFLLGLLISFASSLPGKLKNKKAIKTLNYTNQSLQNELASLKGELDPTKSTSDNTSPEKKPEPEKKPQIDTTIDDNKEKKDKDNQDIETETKSTSV